MCVFGVKSDRLLDNQLKPLIKEVYQQYRGNAGAPRIKAMTKIANPIKVTSCGQLCNHSKPLKLIRLKPIRTANIKLKW